MTQKKGAKKPIITTPKGAANYPWLNEPDTKFGPPTYKADVLVDVGESKALTDRIDAAMERTLSHYQETAGDDITEVYADEPPYFEDSAGVICFRTKLNKEGKNKTTGEEWINKITFFDAARNPIPESAVPKIGGGSIIRVSAEMRPWAMPVVEGRGANQKKSLRVGVKLSIKAVQIIEARQGGAPVSADAMGFEEEDGFDYQEEGSTAANAQSVRNGGESEGASGFDDLDF